MRRFSHLHLLVKRSRRNNRDSLAAIEIPRVGLYSLLLSLFFFSIFLSPSRARPVSLSFTPNRVSCHAYEWNCFAASRKNVTLLNDSRLFIAAVNQHRPCCPRWNFEVRGTIIRSSFRAFPLGPLYAGDIVSKRVHTYLPPFTVARSSNKLAIQPL